MSSATTKGLEGICLEISCENGGTCELVGESDIDFQCRCSLGWTGDYCEDGKLSTCFKTTYVFFVITFTRKCFC